MKTNFYLPGPAIRQTQTLSETANSAVPRYSTGTAYTDQDMTIRYDTSWTDLVREWELDEEA